LIYSAIAELVRASLLIVGALFPIVDGPDNIPYFLTLTEGLSTGNRAVLARKIGVNSFALLIGSVLVGTHILTFFGISLPVVQVGGGLVVVTVGWNLLNRPDKDYRGAAVPSKQPTLSSLSGRAFYPLTMPLTVGPGAISIAIAVGANRAGSAFLWVLPVAAVLGCALLAASVYLMYRFAEPIGRVLGETAMNIIIRLSSFLLVCIGVQIVWNGVSVLLRTIFRPA
jgi:multiple antibiotic resistance protein